MWMPVVGFPSYEVSTDGRVRNRRTGHELAQYRCYKGYRQVSLYGKTKKGKARTFSRRVHLLVASAFLGPRPGCWLVDHIDHDKGNARLDNLRYISPSENTARAIAAGRFSPKPPRRGS